MVKTAHKYVLQTQARRGDPRAELVISLAMWISWVRILLVAFILFAFTSHSDVGQRSEYCARILVMITFKVWKVLFEKVSNIIGFVQIVIPSIPPSSACFL